MMILPMRLGVGAAHFPGRGPFFRVLPLLAPAPSPIELGVNSGADSRASQRNEVIVLARLA
jgi:hypothetical protein